MPAPKKKSEEPKVAQTTRYVVQMKRRIYNLKGIDDLAQYDELVLDLKKDFDEIETWQDVGVFEAPSGNKRKVCEMAMESLGIQGGEFHAVPESSMEVLVPRLRPDGTGAKVTPNCTNEEYGAT